MKIQEKLNSDGMLAGYLIDDIEYIPAVGNNERYIEILKIVESGEEVLKDNLMEVNKDELRVFQIKSKAKEIITSKYSIEWQLNHPRLDETYTSQYVWIDSIRQISNEAESEGTALEDIDWSI